MPLLPRPWPEPSTFSGVANSTCNWQSPNFCLDVMLPPAAVATPPSTFHLSPPSQPSMLLPSNNTTASTGGPPGGPGSRTFGSGQIMPLLYSSTHQAAAKEVRKLRVSDAASSVPVLCIGVSPEVNLMNSAW